jgi:hypothetical protein
MLAWCVPFVFNVVDTSTITTCTCTPESWNP